MGKQFIGATRRLLVIERLIVGQRETLDLQGRRALLFFPAIFAIRRD